jgi:hypothetical protein
MAETSTGTGVNGFARDEMELLRGLPESISSILVMTQGLYE